MEPVLVVQAGKDTAKVTKAYDEYKVQAEVLGPAYVEALEIQIRRQENAFNTDDE